MLRWGMPPLVLGPGHRVDVPLVQPWCITISDSVSQDQRRERERDGGHGQENEGSQAMKRGAARAAWTVE